MNTYHRETHIMPPHHHNKTSAAMNPIPINPLWNSYPSNPRPKPPPQPPHPTHLPKIKTHPPPHHHIHPSNYQKKKSSNPKEEQVLKPLGTVSERLLVEWVVRFRHEGKKRESEQWERREKQEGHRQEKWRVRDKRG